MILTLMLMEVALFNTKTHILRVFQRRKMLRIDGLCKKMGYKDTKLLMLYEGRSSINRYLQWKSGKVWSKSFSAGDDSCNSCSELEDGKSHEKSFRF
ncbi:hypothetical protein ES319_D01G101100v1 [Gossypium barbadense]|uniref:Uncharacterized protein n=1 Tax=Gossypium barbadense TaxID=3634 RepID=A0A5J5SLT7_GOSBA|nr:hypothetical protein ES319_D01G101100v1 [Gossypium barbadense]